MLIVRPSGSVMIRYWERKGAWGRGPYRRWKTSESNKGHNGVEPNEPKHSTINSSRKNLPAFTNSSIATSINHVRNAVTDLSGVVPSNNTDSISKSLEDDGYGLHRNRNSMRWIRHFQEPPDPGTLILVRHGKNIIIF